MRIAVGFLTAGVAAEFFHRQIIAVAIPPLQKELGFSDTEAGALIFAFATGYAVFSLVLGRIADRGNRRNIYVAGMALWSLATAAAAACSSFAMLMATRLLVGGAQGASGACNGPILADYVKPERRSGAMALVSVGAALGVLGALIGGAFATAALGWRGFFVWSGVGGVAFALLFVAMVAEPPRGWSEGHAEKPGEQPPVRDALRVITHTPALRDSVIAVSLANTALLAPAQWGPTFFTRVYHMNLADAGVAGGVAGLFAVGGGVAGGLIADRMWLRDARNVLRLPGICALIASPLCFLAFRAPNAGSSIVLLVLSTGLGMIHTAPAGAVLQALAPLRTRALLSGVVNALLTFVAMGGGPLLTGWLSDQLGSSNDGAGLARALSYSAFLYFGAGVFLVRASRTLVPDLERVRAAA
ncbi:MAG TPA: MFS transporter [Myxococcota bacterium]|nr:MFS transporter [Myxococcota bacterium]